MWAGTRTEFGKNFNLLNKPSLSTMISKLFVLQLLLGLVNLLFKLSICKSLFSYIFRRLPTSWQKIFAWRRSLNLELVKNAAATKCRRNSTKFEKVAVANVWKKRLNKRAAWTSVCLKQSPSTEKWTEKFLFLIMNRSQMCRFTKTVFNARTLVSF